MWSLGWIVLSILTPLVWVRNISKFSITFLIGNLLILSTVIIVIVFLSIQFVNRNYTLGPNLLAINYGDYWGMIGFSVYTFEGIGCVMPIMEKCACPEKYDKILIAAIATLTFMYIMFSEFSYLMLGSNITHQFIT